MADQRPGLDAAGCLGRALTTLGVIWIGIVVLGGIGVLPEVGWTGGFFAGIGGSMLPGLLLLFAGRAVRRRTAITAQSRPTPSVPVTPRPAQSVPIPFPIGEPSPPPPPPGPRPSLRPGSGPELTAAAVSRPEEVLPPIDEEPAEEAGAKPPFGAEGSRPRTSQEMIDEARRRWGTQSKP